MNPSEMEEERRSVRAMLTDLNAVGGCGLVHRLLSNFAARLTELLDPAAEARGWSSADAHALAGISGMLGFSHLASVSRAGMDEEHPRPPHQLIEAAMAALAITAALLSRPKLV